MKIRNKFSVIMFCITAVTVFSTISIILNIFEKSIEDDKQRINEALTSQVLISFGLLSDDIESTLFTNIMNESIPKMMLDEPGSVKQFNLTTKLQTVCDRTEYVDALFVRDNDGICYSNDVSPEKSEHVQQLIADGFFDDCHGLTWIRDEKGNVFLHRQLNSLFPLASAGELISVIREDMLWMSMGIQPSGEEYITFYNQQGELVLISDPSMMSKPHAQEKLLYSSASDGVWKATSYQERGVKWIAIYNVMAASIQIGGLMVAMSTILSFLISYSITRSIDALVKRTKEVGKGKFEGSLPVRSHDEIGHLTKHFNSMSQKLQDITKQLVAETEEKEKARYELLELQYRSLQSKVSPHFICNILTAVNGLAIGGEIEKVETLSSMAGKYLRNNLCNHSRKFFALAEELDGLRSYVRLYHEVFSAPFNFHVDCDESIEDCQVPAYILQPLVENILKHGLHSIGNRMLNILVSVRRENDFLVMAVQDNGCGMDEETISNIRHGKSGYGFHSVFKRLHLLYGNSASVEIHSQPFEKTAVYLRIPYMSYAEKNE